jgi:hypothetical protein
MFTLSFRTFLNKDYWGPFLRTSNRPLQKTGALRDKEPFKPKFLLIPIKTLSVNI